MDEKENLKGKFENTLNKNENPTYQFWKAAKAVIREKFIALKCLYQKKKGFKTLSSVSTLRNQKKKTKINPNHGEGNTSAEISENENKNNRQKSMKSKTDSL